MDVEFAVSTNIEKKKNGGAYKLFQGKYIFKSGAMVNVCLFWNIWMTSRATENSIEQQ